MDEKNCQQSNNSNFFIGTFVIIILITFVFMFHLCVQNEEVGGARNVCVKIINIQFRFPQQNEKVTLGSVHGYNIFFVYSYTNVPAHK